MVNIVCFEELLWVYSKHLGCASILGELMKIVICYITYVLGFFNKLSRVVYENNLQLT